MEGGIKAIIFDWVWTLYNPRTRSLFDGAPELLAELSARYTLVLVSLASSKSSKERREEIQESGVAKYLKVILVDDKDKNAMYKKTLAQLEVFPEETAIVDDRTVRGIAWGNSHGVMTIWVRQGEFADDSPSKATGEPTMTIRNIAELRGIFLKSV
jgi:FMN phosphatase YigB (HAD superfamily)